MSVLFSGGVQLQTFRSTHTINHGETDKLLLTHGSDVFVTVVATNAAGLSQVFYSSPETMDLTPPQICCIQVSMNLVNTYFCSVEEIHCK